MADAPRARSPDGASLLTVYETPFSPSRDEEDGYFGHLVLNEDDGLRVVGSAPHHNPPSIAIHDTFSGRDPNPTITQSFWSEDRDPNAGLESHITHAPDSPNFERLPASPTPSLSSASAEEDEPQRVPSIMRSVPGLRTIARICAGGSAVATAAARRQRRDENTRASLERSSLEVSSLDYNHSYDGSRPGTSMSYDSWGRTSTSLSHDSHNLSPSLEGHGEPLGESLLTLRSISSVQSATSADTAGSDVGVFARRRKWLPWTSQPERNGRIEVAVVTRNKEPFAKEVAVTGWQVVGGKSFDDRGKVGAYVVYDIVITLRNGTTVNIMRRYTEFRRLRDELRNTFPQLRKTIPALPGKNHMAKFSPEFLEERRPRLQRFLRTVMLHPEMGVGGDDSVVARWVIG